MPVTWIRADLGPGVTALVTTRAGGVSNEPYGTLNLGPHVGDDPARVRANRSQVERVLGLPVVYVNQVHGTDVLLVKGAAEPMAVAPDADALVTGREAVALAVMVADCMPILLADVEAGVVAAAHAGRRGLAVGVIPATIDAMVASGARREQVRAYVGPAICGTCYEVGQDVQAEVAAVVPAAASTTTWGTPGLDLPAGAAAQLAAEGVAHVRMSGLCTLEDHRFFSHRRDGVTGRFAGIVALVPRDTPRRPS